MTDCEKFAEKILLSHGELTAGEAEDFERHCLSCLSCRQKLEQLSRTCQAVCEVPEPNPACWDCVWDNVQKRSRKQHPRGQLWRSLTSAAAVTAVAAGILIAAYVMMPPSVETIVPVEVAPGEVKTGFELVEIEVDSPDFEVTVLVGDADEIPVIWLERM